MNRLKKQKKTTGLQNTFMKNLEQKSQQLSVFMRNRVLRSISSPSMQCFKIIEESKKVLSI